ncbi:MAG: PilZ domain-containing protein [Candidatus Omnitrophica bacterium]|nr:PilZ domain-containing protein [Candidatus Omnitrophota bacterium]
MTEQGKDRRKYKRFNMDAEIYFDFIYDLETKVEFELIDQKGEKVLSEKYTAISRNVSVGGLCFSGSQQVKQDDLLHIEVYLPRAKKPIHMKGRVAWCKPITPSYEDRIKEEVEGERTYEVGVRLLYVDGKSVDESIHHDAVYDVDWSVVLESVFGNFKMLMEGTYKQETE